MHEPHSAVFRNADLVQVEEIELGLDEWFSVGFGGSDSIMEIRPSRSKEIERCVGGA